MSPEGLRTARLGQRRHLEHDRVGCQDGRSECGCSSAWETEPTRSLLGLHGRRTDGHCAGCAGKDANTANDEHIVVHPIDGYGLPPTPPARQLHDLEPIQGGPGDRSGVHVRPVRIPVEDRKRQDDRLVDVGNRCLHAPAPHRHETGTERRFRVSRRQLVHHDFDRVGREFPTVGHQSHGPDFKTPRSKRAKPEVSHQGPVADRPHRRTGSSAASASASRTSANPSVAGGTGSASSSVTPSTPTLTTNSPPPRSPPNGWSTVR